MLGTRVAMKAFGKNRNVVLFMLSLPVLGFIYLGTDMVMHSKRFLRTQETVHSETSIPVRRTTTSTESNPRIDTTQGPVTAFVEKTKEQKSQLVETILSGLNLNGISNIDPTIEDKLMAMVANERLAGLEHGCRFSGKEYKLDVKALLKLESQRKPRFYYSDKYKLLVCEVPKCGSTSWKKSILIMDGVVNASKPEDISGGAAHTIATKLFLWADFNASDPASVAKAEERITNYRRVMTVREPLKRLVSAFKDKILPTGTGGQSFGRLSRNIHEQYKDGNASSSTKPDKGVGYASWEEFVRYLLDPQKKIYMDVHWKMFSEFCYPCKTNYDYIVKLETVYHDIKYISRLIGFDMTAFFPAGKEESRHKKWEGEYASFFSKLSGEQRQNLYQMYLNEYELFGYRKPDFVMT